MIPDQVRENKKGTKAKETPVNKSYWVSILASKRNGTLYVGVTNNLARRVFEHKTHAIPGFTKRYGVTRLMYYERFDWINDARHREATLKRWRRAWKIELIEKANPQWNDLYDTLM